MNALIIEDEQAVRICIKRILDPFGINFIEADSLGTGIERSIEHKNIDLIILDLRLPDSPADTTIKNIPNFKSMHPEAAVLVMTGLSIDEMEEKCLAQGADHFATKDSIRSSGALCAAIVKSLEHNRKLPVNDRLSRSVELLRATASSVIEND